MSNGFRFPLEKVLEMRLEEEQRQARLMADARRDARAAREAVQNLEAVRNESRDRLTAAHSTGRSVGQLQNLEWILERMEGEIEQAQEQAKTADQAMDDRMQAFQAAVRKRQSLDKLRRRQAAEWSEAEKVRDRKAMDDAALTRYVRAEEGLLTEGQETS